MAEMLSEVLPCRPESGFPDPGQHLVLLKSQVEILVFPSLEQMLLLSLEQPQYYFTCSKQGNRT